MPTFFRGHCCFGQAEAGLFFRFFLLHDFGVQDQQNLAAGHIAAADGGKQIIGIFQFVMSAQLGQGFGELIERDGFAVVFQRALPHGLAQFFVFALAF